MNRAIRNSCDNSFPLKNNKTAEIIVKLIIFFEPRLTEVIIFCVFVYIS